MRRGPRHLAFALLGAWTLAVLVTGADMLAVWLSQLHGAGQPGDAYVAASQRLALLAIVGACPPCLAWMLWRIAARMTGATPARSR
jgi:hypothetical protein